MTNSTEPSAMDALLATARVKFISVLVVIALALGIVAEFLSIVSGYYNMHKLAAEMTTAVETAKNAERRAKAEADRAQNEVTKTAAEAQYADRRSTAETTRAEAESVISGVNKRYAQSIGKYP